MKLRFSLLFFVCLAFVTISNAQFVRGYGIKVGATDATQMWNYSSGGDFPTDQRWGLDIGGFVEVVDIPFLSVLTEVHYLQKGFKYSVVVTSEQEPDGTGETRTFAPRLDYLSIPVLAKFRLETPFITPFLVAGPRIDFLVAREDNGVSAIFDKLRKTDVGASIGMGMEIRDVVVPAITAEFRYSPAFSEVFNNNNLKVKNESFELLLGIQL